MPHFFVDDGFSDSKEILAIPTRHRLGAVGLWTLCGSWSANKLTDGWIPAEVLKRFGATAAVVDALIEKAGLFERHIDGVQMTNWPRWQRTRDSVKSYRAYQADKKRRQREAAKLAAISADTKMSPGDTMGDAETCPQGTPLTPIPKPPIPPIPNSSYLDDDCYESNARDADEPPPPDEPPPEPQPLDGVAVEVVAVSEPAYVESITRKQPRHPSDAAKTVVRQTLGAAGYPKTTIDRLAVQVGKLAREGHPDNLIRRSLTEWDHRADAKLPEYLPTVLGDLVKQARADPINGHRLQGAELKIAQFQALKSQFPQELPQ